MGLGRGRTPEQHSCLLPDDREVSAMGVVPGRAPDQESFLLPEEGEQSTMGVGQGRAPEQHFFLLPDDGEERAMGIGQGRAPERMPPQEAGLAERSIDDQADIIHNLLLNLNYDSRREVIIKLVSNSEI